jgi:hypothetical protein
MLEVGVTGLDGVGMDHEMVTGFERLFLRD